MVYSLKIENLLKVYSYIHLIRSTEERIANEYSKQEIRCPTHLSIGQEVVPSVLSLFITKNDLCVSTHRSHAHYIAKGGCLNSFISELYGKSFGCSKGKGGSMHLIDLKVGFMGSSAIVGNSIPVGVGLGYRFKNKKSNKNFSIAFFGDGAVEEGVFYESLNLASVKKIPILFICENNNFSVYSSLKVRQPKNRSIAKLSEYIGVKAISCDGNDISKVYKTIKFATDYIKQHQKPFFLEFSTYRWREHCGPNFDDYLNYRNKNTSIKMIKNDPLNELENYLKNKLIKGNVKINHIKKKNYKKIDIAFINAQKNEKDISKMALMDEFKKIL